MRLPKFLILIASVSAVGVLGMLTVLIVRELDETRQEQRITELAEALTGRQVETRGGLRIGFSLRPTLIAEDVRFANASWGNQPTMLTAERVDVSLALIPLLFGRVDLTYVRFSGVRLLLETDATGRRNWDLGDGEPGGDAEWFQTGVFAEHLLVEDLVLEIRGPHSKAATRIEVTRLELAADTVSQPLSLELSARLAGTEFAAAGSIGSLSDWLSGEKLPLQLDLRWGNSKFTTDATLDLGGRPRLRGRVRSGRIDLEAWLAKRREHPGAAVDTLPEGRLFPTAPLGLAALGSAAVDVSLAVGDVLDEQAGIELTHAEVALEGGVLRLEPVRAVFGAAPVEASLEIDARAEVPRVRLSFFVRELDLGDLLERLELTDQVEAFVDVDVKLRGSGDSVAAILGSADGNADFSISRGEIPTRFVDRFVSDLSSLIMPWARPPNRVKIECAIVEFALERGVARSQVLMFDTPRLTLRGQGEIDLANETLDLALAPRPRDHELLSLATDLTLNGPLSGPRASPSPIGLVSTVARLALTPVRIFTPLLGETAARQIAPLVGGDAARTRDCADRMQAVSTERRGSS